MRFAPHNEPENLAGYFKSGGMNFTPWGFTVRAREFLDASVLLSESAGRFSFVAAFLSCRSIEMGLKAYLLSQGDSMNKVRRMRHDLMTALAKCDTRGIARVVDFTPSDRALLLVVNEDYTGNAFAYFDVHSAMAMPSNPDLNLLPAIARKLLDGIAEVCKPL